MTLLFKVGPRAAAYLLLACAGGALASAGIAQAQSIAPSANEPVEQLGRYIRILAGSPRDLTALLGAGRAALDVGDANAALGFFARAEEAAPTNGQAKAGLGASLVAMERPDDALRLFAQALSLGVPEASIARDRGLAYDLRGDSRRAQRDYLLATARGPADDELVRRYALSLGISGDREAALKLLDPLLRRQDQGAWRAKAFVMAMNGDVAGANGVARQLMVPAMANAMAPLLGRLATLNAAERAHAVNFGTVPAEGSQMAMVQIGDPYLGGSAQMASLAPGPAGSGLVPSGVPLGAREPKSLPQAQPVSSASRRRPDRAVQVAALASPAGAPKPSVPQPAVPQTPAVPKTVVAQTAAPTPSTAEPSTPAFEVPPLPTTKVPAPVVKPVVPPIPARAAKPPVTSPVTTPQPTRMETLPTPVPTPSVTPAQQAAASRLAGLLAGLQTEPETTVELPSVREIRLARAAARKKTAELAAQAAAEKAAKEKAAVEALAAKRNPARTWVQVATGRNDSGLALTWKRIKGDHETALKGQSAWSVPFKATNRVVVGPMKSPSAARELVNKLGKDGLSATVFVSEAGEEVAKIAAK